MFGGKSPINEQNQALVRALRDEFAARGIDTPLLWGNRNWQPYLAEVVGNHARMHGSRRFLAIDTSAYSSYSSCRQYREDFASAVAALEEQGIEVVIDKVRQYYNHPGFAQAQLDCLRRGLGEFKQLVGGLDRSRHKILFVTHSIPTSMQKSSEKFTVGYQGQHEELMKWLSAELDGEEQLDAELVFCSRSDLRTLLGWNRISMTACASFRIPEPKRYW